jgi:molybdate transport system ATP-binding protein
VLLLDEPFAALDLELRRALRQELRALLKESGVPVILVTHDQEEALALGDAVQVLDHGHAIACGEPLSVLGHPSESRVAQLVGVENLLHMMVVERHSDEGIMICCRGEVRLETPLLDAKVGDAVTLGIRARDIILASVEPKGLSARNLLRGQVASVEPIGAGYDVFLDCGVTLRCHITQRALAELQIAPGKTVWAVVKASSIFVVNE